MSERKPIRKRWDSAELILIRDKLAETFSKMPHANYKTLLDVSQSVLPDDRKANIKYPSFVPLVFRSMVDNLRAEMAGKSSRQKVEKHSANDLVEAAALVEALHPTAMDSEPDRDFSDPSHAVATGDLGSVATVQLLAELLV